VGFEASSMSVAGRYGGDDSSIAGCVDLAHGAFGELVEC
jgi:hypothetical protein